jgi:hypothetical protein
MNEMPVSVLLFNIESLVVTFYELFMSILCSYSSGSKAYKRGWMTDRGCDGWCLNLICFKECFQVFLESSIFKGTHEYVQGAVWEIKWFILLVRIYIYIYIYMRWVEINLNGFALSLITFLVRIHFFPPFISLYASHLSFPSLKSGFHLH